jgi:hypothetical protein
MSTSGSSRDRRPDFHFLESKLMFVEEKLEVGRIVRGQVILRNVGKEIIYFESEQPLVAGLERSQAVAPCSKRTKFNHAARTLQLLGILLAFCLFIQSPALSAARSNILANTAGHRNASLRSCSDTKVLETDGARILVPSCWTLGDYTEGSMFTNVFAFLSNQPMHKPCITTRSGTSTTVRCGFPVKTLKRGGVLVIFLAGGIPGWTIAKVKGQHLVVDHHAARETMIQKPYRSLRATDEFWIYISKNVPYNYYEFEAFFRNPGATEDHRLLQNMLNSMTIQ